MARVVKGTSYATLGTKLVGNVWRRQGNASKSAGCMITCITACLPFPMVGRVEALSYLPNHHQMHISKEPKRRRGYKSKCAMRKGVPLSCLEGLTYSPPVPVLFIFVISHQKLFWMWHNFPFSLLFFLPKPPPATPPLALPRLGTVFTCFDLIF